MKLTNETIDTINLFEAMTKSKVKNCYINKNILFIVNEGQAGKTIGKHGIKIKRLSFMFKKKIRVVEFNKNPEKFVENLIYPLQAEITRNDNAIIIKAHDIKTKGLLIGRERQNLKKLNKIVAEYFDNNVVVQ